MPSSSAAQFPAFMVSGSVLASMTLEDIRDGDDAKGVNLSTNVAPLVIYDGDGIIISPEVQIEVTATVTNFIGTPFYQFFTPVDPTPAISTQNTLSIGYQDLPLPGETFLINVQVRDGSNNPLEPIAAQASLTIAGLQEGISAYNATLTNDNVSIVYRVSGEVELSGTGTTITATKGVDSLTHANPFSPQDVDNFFNEIGSLGEYQVSIHSKSAYLGLAGGLVSSSILPVVSGQAVIGDLVSWTTADSNPIGSVVYRIDFENGNGVAFKTQSFSVQFEGNTGPGIVMRGQYTEYQNYIGSYETTNLRRDAVIWPDPSGSSGITHYFAALSGSGPNTYVNPTISDYYVGGSPPGGYVLIGNQYPPAPTNDNDYWQYLGEQDFFVEAKIAIFDESFVKNTINIGNNPDSSFANIVLAGGRTDPYMAIGQVGTIGNSGDQTGSGIIGYDRPGIFLGMYENAVTNGTNGRFSISNADGSKAMKWDGTDLTIIGGIRQISPGVREPQLRGVWIVSNEYFNNDVVSYNGQSWICTSATSHTSTNDTNASTGYPGEGPWNIYIASGPAGPGVVYRGIFNTSANYFHTTQRIDVVKEGSTYYLANNTSLDGQSGTNWGTPPNSNWTTFGAQFTSVATDLLFAVEQYVDKTINIGEQNGNALIVLNANESGSNANPYISIGQISSSIGPGSIVTQSQVQGFNNDGIFLGFDSGIPKVSLIAQSGSLIWDGNNLTVRGTVNSNNGNIGGWDIGPGRIISTNQNIQLISEPSESIAVFDDSGSLRFFANTRLTLPDPTGVAYSSTVISSFTTSSNQTSGVPNDGNYNLYYGGRISYDYYKIPSTNPSFTATVSGQHIITCNIPAFSSYVQPTGDAYGFISLRLALTTVGHFPQSPTNQIASSNTLLQSEYGIMSSYLFWNGSEYVTYYYANPITRYLPAGKLSIIADLQSGVTYYFTLVGNAYLESKDTTSIIQYPPSGVTSEVDAVIGLPSNVGIDIKAISAGTIVNGGGFQAVLADDKYLRVRDGISGSYNFSTEITGSLMVDRAISRYSLGYGYPPAVKAFCRVLYNGGDVNLATSYTIRNQYNVSTTLTRAANNRYLLTFLNPMDSAEYTVFITPSNSTYATSTVATFGTVTDATTTQFGFRMVKPDEAGDGAQVIAIGARITDTAAQTGEWADVVVIGR